MREKTSSEKLLQTLDQQTMTTLMRQMPDRQHASWSQRRGHPFNECLQQQAALVYYLLDLADEGRGLIDIV